MGSGDWNDGFSTVGNKGKGESVWLAFFLCAVLEKFVKICEFMEKRNITNLNIQDSNLSSNISLAEQENIIEQSNEKNENNQVKIQEKLSEKYKRIIEQLRKSINNNAWDGRWFKRAFMDDGRALRKFAK